MTFTCRSNSLVSFYTQSIHNETTTQIPKSQCGYDVHHLQPRAISGFLTPHTSPHLKLYSLCWMAIARFTASTRAADAKEVTGPHCGRAMHMFWLPLLSRGRNTSFHTRLKRGRPAEALGGDRRCRTSCIAQRSPPAITCMDTELTSSRQPSVRESTRVCSQCTCMGIGDYASYASYVVTMIRPPGCFTWSMRMAR